MITLPSCNVFEFSSPDGMKIQLPMSASLCQENHEQGQAFGDGDGEPHALGGNEHGHQDKGRNQEEQTAKQHKDRCPNVLLYGLIVADDGNIQGKEYGRDSKQW